MTEFEFTLHLSTDEYRQFYEGLVNAVQVKSTCGKTIRFPADKLRDFVLKDGVHGTFIIRVDKNNKFLSVRRK